MPLSGIDIICDRFLAGLPNVRYVRLRVTDVSLTIQDVYNSLCDASWVNRLSARESVKDAYRLRVEQTTASIRNAFLNGNGTLDADTGEYVVSESARRYLVNQLHYLDIPLAELMKQRSTGNPGFDFFSMNLNDVLLFGEAKYRGNGDESGSREAIGQINEFVFGPDPRDVSDIAELQAFLTDAADSNFKANQKGYVAAFTTWQESDEHVIDRITRHPNFSSLTQFPELICVAIQVVS